MHNHNLLAAGIGINVPPSLEHVDLRYLLTAMTAIEASSRPTLAEVAKCLQAIKTGLPVREDLPSFISPFSESQDRGAVVGDLAQASTILSHSNNLFSLNANQRAGGSTHRVAATSLLQLTQTQDSGTTMPTMPARPRLFDLGHAMRKLICCSKERVTTTASHDSDSTPRYGRRRRPHRIPQVRPGKTAMMSA